MEGKMASDSENHIKLLEEWVATAKELIKAQESMIKDLKEIIAIKDVAIKNKN